MMISTLKNIVVLFVGFLAGLIVHFYTINRRDEEPAVQVLPEWVPPSNRLTIETSDNPQVFYSELFKDNHFNTNGWGDLVNLRFIGRPKMFSGIKLIKEGSTEASVLSDTADVGGLRVVWAANEFVIGNDGVEVGSEWVTSKSLLHAAVCSSNVTAFPQGEELISFEQEVELMEMLRRWGLTYTPLPDRPTLCRIAGSTFQLAAIRVEIASLFNKVKWRKMPQN